MGTKRTTEIKQAIASDDISRARKLISTALKNEPDADIYYLASLVALDGNQKKEFLDKALGLDPFHEEANNLLEENQSNAKTQETSRNSNPNKIANIQISKEPYKLPNLSFLGDNYSWLGRIRIGVAVGLSFSLITSTIISEWLISTILFLTTIGGLAGFISPPNKKFNTLTVGIFTLFTIFYTIIYTLKQETLFRYGMIIPGIWRGGVYGALLGSFISRIIYWLNSDSNSKSKITN